MRAPNSVGVLHRIAKALAELGLDIRHATVQTLGEEVVDTFYVQAPTAPQSPTRSTAARSSAPCSTPSPERPVGSEPAAIGLRWRRAGGRRPAERFTRDLVRWSETLAAIARTGLGFSENLYERERFEEVLNVAADIKAAANEALGSTPSRPSRSSASRTTSCRSGWSRSASACPAT